MTQFHSTIYIAATGRIVGTQTHRKPTTIPIAGDQAVLVTEDGGAPDGGTHFVDVSGDPAIAPRAALVATWDKTTIAADGVDQAVLSGLPIPIVCKVDDVPVTVTDGSFEFSATTPGTYLIDIDDVAFLHQAWHITAD